MAGKRGQVGLFIIVGVVIVLLVMILFGLRQQSLSPGKESQKIGEVVESQPMVKKYLEQCMSITLQHALLEQGLYGALSFNGRYTNNMTPPEGIAIFYDEGAVTQPEMQEMLDELGVMMKDNMNYCLEDLGMAFKGDVLATTVTYHDGKVRAEALTDYRVIMQGSELAFETLETEVEFDYLKVYSFVRMILEEEKEDPDWISMTDLMDSGFEVELIQTEEGLIYSLTDKNVTLADEQYVYQFANYFGEEG